MRSKIAAQVAAKALRGRGTVLGIEGAHCLRVQPGRETITVLQMIGALLSDDASVNATVAILESAVSAVSYEAGLSAVSASELCKILH